MSEKIHVKSIWKFRIDIAPISAPSLLSEGLL
jgi:hypothetical protein